MQEKCSWKSHIKAHFTFLITQRLNEVSSSCSLGSPFRFYPSIRFLPSVKGWFPWRHILSSGTSSSASDSWASPWHHHPSISRIPSWWDMAGTPPKGVVQGRLIQVPEPPPLAPRERSMHEGPVQYGCGHPDLATGTWNVT